MSRSVPFWSIASLVSDSAEPEGFQVSLEDMVPNSGRLVEGKLSRYSAKGTPFSAGDVLFGKLRPYLGKYWLADRAGTAGGDIHVYRPYEEVDSRFLNYVVGSRDFVKFAEAISKGTKMPRAEWPGLKDFRVTHFDRDKQCEIADHLDRETKEIDAMVAKLDTLADMLRSRITGFKAIILARTSERRALRWMVSDINTGPFGTQVKQSEYVDDGVPLINPSHIVGDRIVPQGKVSVSPEKAAELGRFELQVGDVVVARRGELGRCAVVRGEDAPAICGTGSLRIRPDVDLALPEYVQLVISSPEAIRELEQLSVGSTMDNLNERLLGEVSVPLLPVAEQTEILDHLETVTARVDAMLGKVAKLKELLIERRSALITDMLTGRKEVA